MNTISFSQFGRWGRFGNQLLQYAFLRCYADRHGCELQLPPWVGNQVFGLSNPPVTTPLPVYGERHEGDPRWTDACQPEGDEFVNKNFEGYAQFHTSWYTEREIGAIRRWFRPTAVVRNRFTHVPVGRSGVWFGIHLRRGDYGQGQFYITPTEWYQQRLAEVWGKCDRAERHLFIATEDPSLVDAFAEYEPVTTGDMGIELRAEPMENYAYLSRDLQECEPWQLDFFPDWYLLSQCDVILMPNSTFSFTAALMGAYSVHRSHLPTQTFEEITPWSAYPLQRDRVEDYPDVKGVRLAENPYW